MKLQTGETFDIITLEPPRGLIVVMDNISGSQIEFSVNYAMLPNGTWGLTFVLPPDKTFRHGSAFFVLGDTLNANKIELGGGVVFEKVR